MSMLQPNLAILDETDSGLDIDALKIVAKGVNEYRNKTNSIVLITYYQRFEARIDFVRDFMTEEQLQQLRRSSG